MAGSLGTPGLPRLAAVRFGWNLAGVVVGEALMLLFPLIRWHVLVAARGLRVSFFQAMVSGFAGYFVGIFVPGGLGIDATRFAYAYGENRDRRADLFSTLVMDRLLGLLALTLLATVFGGLLYASAHTEAVLRIVAASAVCLIGLLGVSAVLCSSRLTPLLGPLRRWKPVSRVSHAMQAYSGHPRALGIGLLLSILGHVSAFGAAYFAFCSLHNPASIFAVFATAPLVNLSGMVPLAPLGLGVTDSVAVTLYATVGLSGGAEVNMLLRGVTVFLSILCAAGLLMPAAASRETATEAGAAAPQPAGAGLPDKMCAMRVACSAAATREASNDVRES